MADNQHATNVQLGEYRCRVLDRRVGVEALLVENDRGVGDAAVGGDAGMAWGSEVAPSPGPPEKMRRSTRPWW